MTKFGMVTHGRSTFLGSEPRPHTRWAGSQRPQFWGNSYMRAQYDRETTSKFCIVIKLDVREIFISLTANVTRDLFAVANLVLT